MAVDWTARVVNQVHADRAEIVRFLSDVFTVPSVSGSAEENELLQRSSVDLYADDLHVDIRPIQVDDILARPDAPGVEVPREEAWGLVGRLPGGGGGGSTLMLNAHIDVVPPGDLAAWSTPDPYSGRATAKTVYGRGACDMKGGLVAALFAVRTLRRVGVPLRGDLLLALVQGEEDGGLGSYAMLDRGWRADACVIPEPTSLDLVPASAGCLMFRLVVHGAATHGARRTEGVNAIEKFWPVMQGLAALEQRRNASVDPLMRRWQLAYPLSVGRLTAGDWPSSVPDLLVAEGRYGVALDETMESARAELEQAVADVCRRDAWLRDHPVEVQWWGGHFEPGRCVGGTDLLERVRDAHGRVDKRSPEEWGAPYGSDLRLLSAAGIPTVHYGPGDAALAHGPDEAVAIAEVLTSTQALALLALDVCGVR